MCEHFLNGQKTTGGACKVHHLLTADLLPQCQKPGFWSLLYV